MTRYEITVFGKFSEQISSLKVEKNWFAQRKNNTKKLDTRVSFVMTYSPNFKGVGQLMKKIHPLYNKIGIYAPHLFFLTTLLEKLVAT